MAHFHTKKKNGRPYLYVREIARVGGKPKVISQVYIGSPERVRGLASGMAGEEKKLKVEEFGALWLAEQADRDINIVGIINSIIPRQVRETGPTVGEYFLYCIFNRMVEAVSKNKLSNWYNRTAIQHIRPVEISELTSQKYWEKWERVNDDDLEEAARRFFQRIWETESPGADCLLFDSTNYYTFMASNTESNLARRGKNKAGRHYLRQVGLGLLSARENGLPLYYCVYPGNLHDSHLFEKVMDEMFGIVCNLNSTKSRLTVVVDKGMNSADNYAWIDDHSRIHFVTTYSPYFAEDIARTPIENFEPVDTKKNRELSEAGQPGERILCYRTKGEYWGKERTVVVTYNPATARKKDYQLESKLETIRQELLQMRSNVRQKEPHWRKADPICERYLSLCERMHIPSDLYSLDFHQTADCLSMSFRKNMHRIECKRALFGKNIIITDNTDWTTPEIIEANLDRWRIEKQFRLSKDDDLVSVQPLRHWTDSKIRCHLFTCVVAMTYLRKIELRLRRAGITRTAEDVMNDMQHFHSVLSLAAGARKPVRHLEYPTKTQVEVLTAFGHRVNGNGVLQPIPR